jgi:hypothetical protein
MKHGNFASEQDYFNKELTNKHAHSITSRRTNMSWWKKNIPQLQPLNHYLGHLGVQFHLKYITIGDIPQRKGFIFPWL